MNDDVKGYFSVYKYYYKAIYHIYILIRKEKAQFAERKSLEKSAKNDRETIKKSEQLSHQFANMPKS